MYERADLTTPHAAVAPAVERRLEPLLARVENTRGPQTTASAWSVSKKFPREGFFMAPSMRSSGGQPGVDRFD